MKTFTQTITLSDEMVDKLANFLCYKDKIVDESLQEVENPESKSEFIDRMAKEGIKSWLKPFADYLIKQELDKLNIQETVTQTVMNSITTEVVTS